MELWLKITINAICSQFAVLMLAKIESKKERHLLDYRLFELMLISICVLLIAHSLALFADGSETRGLHVLLRICVSLLFPAAAFLAMIYAMHIEKLTNKITRRTKFWIIPFSIPFIVIIGLNIASEFTGWFYTFDEHGYFKLGRFIYIPIILSFGYIFAALFNVVRHKKLMNNSEFANLVSVSIPMIVAGSLQSFLQDFPLLLPGCVLSLFLVFSNIQERRLSFDHLTGAYNRQKLDEFLPVMIENMQRSGKIFSAFLADVNKFKSINDNFGHTEGDKALVTVVNTIRAEIRNNDFLARYAGDEFVVIFPNCAENELDEIIKRINIGFAELSMRETKYPLSISIGAAVFETEIDIDSEKYIKRLDALMYQSKKEFHK